MSETPETQKAVLESDGQWSFVLKDCCERLERERDDARKELYDIRLNLGEDAEGYTLTHAVCVLQNERDEAVEDSLEQARLLGMGSEREAKLISERDEARESLKHISEYGTDEINAAVELRQKLAQALVERDGAREALMKIEDLFIDGTDIYADRENMGIIARNALEGLEGLEGAK